MKYCNVILFVVFTITASVVFGQVTITPSTNATQLAQMLAGPGVVVSNATITGGSGATGSFTAVNSNIGLGAGVVLSSSNVTSIPGVPSTDISDPICWGCNDADLLALAQLTPGSGTATIMRDVVTLEFDVFAIADTLKFNYVFASEEYPGPSTSGWVCSVFNDVFGFFISGPGITGPYSGSSVNIALIPGTTTPVGINTINGGGTSCPSNSQYYNSNNATSNTFVFNGYTTVLQAIIPVQACQTYHLKLKIGDADDDAVDSGVFIEAGSLSSTGISLSTGTNVGGGFNNAIEGCVDGEITFTRTTVDTSSKVVHYAIGGSATNGVDYPTIPDSIIIPPNQASAVLTISPFQDFITEGIETVTIYLVDPCLSNHLDSVTLNIQDSIIHTITSFTTVCPFDSIQLNATGGLNYTWSPANTLSNPNIANPYASPTVTTTYTVNIGVGSCSVTDTVTLVAKPYPPVTAGPDTTLCLFQNVQLNSAAPPGVTYNWSPQLGLNNPYIANPIATPPASTNYILTITDNTGCINKDTVSVQIVNMSNATVNPDTSICAGSAAQLIATGGSTYNWSPGNSLSDSTIANPFASPSLTTTYTVVITSAQGCSTQRTVKVTVNPLPTANAGTDKNICVGGITQLSASGGGTNSWSPTTGLSNPNTANPLANPQSTTDYTVTVTNSSGCTATDDVTVTVSQVQFVNANNDTTVCVGNPVQLSASGGSTYSWSPAAGLSNPNIANPIATPTTTTSYIVTSTNNLGCTDKDTVTIFVGSSSATAVTPKDTTICIGSSVQLNVSGGNSYSWTPATGLSATNIANPVATPTTTTNYIVSIAFSNGCTNTDTAKITVVNPPVANAGADVGICANDSIKLTASGGSIYSWSPVTGLSNPNIASPYASPTSTTTYTVTVSNAAGCVDTDEVTVSVNPLPNANAGADQYICTGNAVQLSGSGGNTYSWSPITGLSNPNIANPMANPSTTTNYILTVANATGCTDKDTVTVFINSLPAISAGQDMALCEGDSVQLNASGGNSYSWTPTAGLIDPNIADPYAKPLLTTTYTVTVSDSNGCSGTDDVTITVNIPAQVTAEPDSAICFGSTLTLNAAGSNSYSWAPSVSLNNPTSATPVATPQTTTIFTVTATDINGCISTDIATVTVNQPPNITLQQGDTTICDGSSVQLGVSGGSNYSWSPSSGLDNPNISNPTATLSAAQTYNVTVTDNNSCSSSTQVNIDIYSPTDPNAQPEIGEICPGETLSLKAENGVSYIWSPAAGLDDPAIADPIASPTATTNYTVTIIDINGCEYSDQLTVNVNPAAVANAGPDGQIVRGQSYTIQGSGNGSFYWSPSIGLSDPNIATPIATPTENITYILEVTTAEGCIAYDTVQIIVDDPSELYLPTAFSPNGDGINDEFKMVARNGVELINFIIVNRWGETIFQTTDINEGWDGKFKGLMQETGTYVYVIRAIGSTGEIFDRRGNITLIR